jgi:hypothetical protein
MDLTRDVSLNMEVMKDFATTVSRPLLTDTYVDIVYPLNTVTVIKEA